MKTHRLYRTVVKRLLDIVFSAVLLVVLSPLLLIIAIVVKADSPGPAVFVQDRLTLGGRVFKMLKFRTMVVNAEKIGTGAYSFDDDPRITKAGKVLRKLSLDELLQLVNIFKGDMSFVGPRPILTYHPCTYDEYTDEEKRVFTVRPGITGWAQVNGRNTVDWVQRFELNEWYVDHVSFGLDLTILRKTVTQVSSAKETVIQEETAKSFKDRKKAQEGERTDDGTI